MNFSVLGDIAEVVDANVEDMIVDSPDLNLQSVISQDLDATIKNLSQILENKIESFSVNFEEKLKGITEKLESQLEKMIDRQLKKGTEMLNKNLEEKVEELTESLQNDVKKLINQNLGEELKELIGKPEEVMKEFLNGTVETIKRILGERVDQLTGTIEGKLEEFPPLKDLNEIHSLLSMWFGGAESTGQITPNRQGCCLSCKCSLADLNYPNRKAFGSSTWRLAPAMYVLYRFILFAVFASRMLQVTVVKYIKAPDDELLVLWPLYDPPNHSLLLLVCYLGTALTVTLLEMFHVQDDHGQTRWFHKVLWILFNVITCVTFFTVAYNCCYSREALIYSINGLAILVDIFITALPCRLLHVWNLFCYAILYWVFVVAYKVARGDHISTSIAVSYITWFSVVSPVLFIGVFMLVKLRDWIQAKTQELRDHCSCHLD